MSDAPPPRPPNWRLSALLFTLTFMATSYVGAERRGASPLDDWNFAAGFAYSVPLMAILLAHEFGHYLAARFHRVPASPPYFIPLPIQPLGTMGAVILMSDRIRNRNALLDIGAAGPLAGMVVALPVLIYGIAQSPVVPLATDATYLMEGRSLLYLALLYLIKGPIPEGQDILLNETAFAGWTGLFVTMLNMIPAAQLDGGHVAYALLGERQQRISQRVRKALLWMGLLVGLGYGLSGFAQGYRPEDLVGQFTAGAGWMVWWLVLRFFTSRQPWEHPPTDTGALSPRRRLVAVLTLALFPLLFMPTWLREVPPLIP